jgi:2-keto-4-pentenoate hydratase/2-oxohepta-3-ene-1,7-dioic acid hydratase in catechol pathway
VTGIPAAATIRSPARRPARAAGEPQARAWSLLEGDDGDQHDEQVRHEPAAGELRQDGSTSQLAWTIAEIVAQVSDVMTLVPGDVIATGSPSGVGFDDGRFLQSGDEVAMEISGVGRLKNPVA